MPQQNKQEIEKRVTSKLNYLRQQGLTSEDILGLAHKLLEIPVKKEVRENLGLSYKEIASFTNRNPAVLAVTYRNARRKLQEKFVERISNYSIPLVVLHDRKLSVLENIVSYLKDTFGLSYHNIAILLNRDDRTIWTVYQRSKKKR